MGGIGYLGSLRGHPVRRRHLVHPVWGFLLLFLASCAGPRPQSQLPGGEVGVASWYGPKFHGRPTASGEIFDMHQLTAAHKTLPLGSWVQVTNLENGRSIQVRVNDRGPFVADRIIDLSYAAARALDMVDKGLARVHVWPLQAPAPRLVRGPGAYTLQVGAFSDKRNAVTLKARLDAVTSGAYISKVSVAGRTFYRVRVGTFVKPEAARRAATEVAAYGFTVILVGRE